MKLMSDFLKVLSPPKNLARLIRINSINMLPSYARKSRCLPLVWREAIRGVLVGSTGWVNWLGSNWPMSTGR